MPPTGTMPTRTARPCRSRPGSRPSPSRHAPESAMTVLRRPRTTKPSWHRPTRYMTASPSAGASRPPPTRGSVSSAPSRRGPGPAAPLTRPESSARSRRRFGTVSGERRRPGVLPLARVLERLEVDAHTVLFGHTHRIGPVDGDPAAWTTAGGVALHNTGSWVLEPAMGITGRGPPGDRPTTLDPY